VNIAFTGDWWRSRSDNFECNALHRFRVIAGGALALMLPAIGGALLFFA
jgi:hypothetical protein